MNKLAYEKILKEIAELEEAVLKGVTLHRKTEYQFGGFPEDW